MKIQRHVFVSGRVQGVFYRQSTAEEAARHPGLQGFVKNLADGRVEALFAGKEDDVLSLVAWCRKGPPLSRVDALEVREEPYSESEPAFRVIR